MLNIADRHRPQGYSSGRVTKFQRPLEGWLYWRINEYPALSLPEGAATTNLVRRLPYPPDELDANSNALSTKPLDEKMWFDK